MEKSQIDEILLPVPAEKAAAQEANVRQEFWSKFRSFAGRIPFAEDAAAAYYCATDPNTPLRVRGTLFAALGYFILPLDAIPDIFALVGMSDDMAVLTAAFALVSSHITDEHRQKAREALRADEPVS